MANGIIYFVLGIIVGSILVYALSNPTLINSISNSKLSNNLLNNTSSPQLSSCISQVDSATSLLQAKVASSTKITIVNTTDFGIASSQSINEISYWANLWNSNRVVLPTQYCNGGGFGAATGYLCSDMSLAQSQSMNVIGVAIKIQWYNTTLLDPLLCGNANLLPSSKSEIIDNNGGVPS